MELPDLCEVELTVQASAKEQAEKPLKRLAALAEQFPENLELPADLAAEHDHYLYGTPKRT